MPVTINKAGLYNFEFENKPGVSVVVIDPDGKISKVDVGGEVGPIAFTVQLDWGDRIAALRYKKEYPIRVVGPRQQADARPS